MDRRNVGSILGVVGAAISLLDSSIVFFVSLFRVKLIGYLVAWYIVALALALVVLCGAFVVHKGRKRLGGTIMFITSMSLPVNIMLLFIPGPVGSMIPILYYNPLPASPWLFLSLMGSILILSSKQKKG